MPCQHNHGQTIATSSTVADDLPSRRSHTDSEVSNTVRSDALDIEKGPPQYERIVLVIEGLQCGCCEGGIERYLTRLAPVRNYQVNIVLARLELELNVSRLSVSDLVTKLHRKTGYKFELLEESGSQTLELLVSAQLDLQRLDRPPGVTLLEHSGYRQRTLSRSSCAVPRQQPTDGAVQPALPTPLSIFKRCFPPLHNGHATRRSNRQAKQSLIRLHYNADEVGARDIFEFYLRLDPDIHLAPRPAHPSLASGSNQIQRALRYFIPALICTIPVVVVAWAPVDHENLAYLHASLVLATVVQLIATKEFLPGPLRSLLHLGAFEMDLLVGMSSTIAYTYSVVIYVFRIRNGPLDSDSFFETSTMLVTLILLGRVINEYARHRAAKSVSFRSLQADETLLLAPNSNNTCEPMTRSIDARLLQYGDCFRIPPHSRVVTDGIVLSGGSEIDESMITGESIPVAKSVHSAVFAGTTNGNGSLVVRLTALPHENSVHKIAVMVEGAELTKPKTQALADRIAACFVPVIATIALLVFLAWLLVDEKPNRRAWHRAVTQALTYTIATLIVSCPCAISLAVPMVVLIAGGVAARFGIIFRDPQKLETARGVTDVVFDKTGTLTRGVLTVIDETFHGIKVEQERTKRIVLSLLQDIEHPVALSVLRHLERDARMNDTENSCSTEVVGVNVVPGCGVQGTLKDSGKAVRAGSPEWLNIDLPPSSCTVFCVSIGDLSSNGLVATFLLQDRERHTAGLVIQRLQDRGIETHMISGDGQGPVDNIAHSLNIPKRNTKFRCTPEGKKNYIRDLQKPGKVIMFVGDGTNDSIGLKQADIGVHISHGNSDVAKAASDVVLMTTRLHDVLILLDISRAAYRRIILNFTWSAIYNVSAILLASGAFTKVMKKARIDPQWAALGELVSVLPVLLIAFQMRWRDYGRKYRAIEYDYLKREAPEEKVKKVVRLRSAGSSEEDAIKCVAGPCMGLVPKKV